MSRVLIAYASMTGNTEKMAEKTMAELNNDDAKADGFENTEELLANLRKNYPSCSEADCFTIIEFQLRQ